MLFDKSNLFRGNKTPGLLAVVLSLCSPYSSSAQQYAFVPVRAANPPRTVGVLLQDRIGRLWAGTDNDVASFDGNRFFYLRDYGFPATEVLSLADDEEGGIWIGSLLGLHRFQKGQLVRIHPGVTRSVVFVAPGIMLAAIGPAEKGIPERPDIYRIQKSVDGWKSEMLPGLRSSGRLMVSHDRSITFANRTSWFEATPESIRTWAAGARLATIERAISGIVAEDAFKDRSNCVWFRNQAMTSYQCAGDPAARQVPFNITSGQAAMSETADGRILLPSETLAIGRPGAFQVARPSNGLPPTSVALMTSDGSIWVGGSKGLFRFAFPFQFEYWNERDGLTDVTSTLRIGNLVFAGDAEGIKQLSSDRRTWSPLPNLPDLRRVWHLIAGPNRTIYAALGYRGVEQIALDGSLLNRPPPNTIPGMRLAQTRDGRLWLAGLGISRVEFIKGQAKLNPEPLPFDRSNGLDIQTNPSNGDLWACYAGGLIQQEPSGWRHIAEKDGLLQSACRSLAVTPNGDVWYGYNTVPAFTLVRQVPGQAPKLLHFRSGGEVGDAQIHFLAIDRRGWLWRGAGDGVYVAALTDAAQGHWLHLKESDGLPALGTNQQGFYEDADNSVWFGADTTLMHFTPPPGLLAAQPASVYLSALSWNGGKPHSPELAAAVPSGSSISAHIGSPRFGSTEKLSLQHRILSGKPNWKDDGTTMDIALGALPWGDHSLEVRARIGQGQWSPIAAYRFAVQRPLWATWPALAGFSLAGVSAALATRAQRRKQQEREDKILPDLSQLRLAALTPETRDLAGATLDGRFRPVRVVERGGFGTVMEAVDLMHGDACAIKVFHRELADEWFTKRFQQEVLALETIAHPNVVRIVAHGVTPNGSPYLVMEFVQGATLRSLMDGQALPPRRIASLLRQLGSALAALHKLGIYHRDLKPENAMVRDAAPPDRDLVLIDFSIAIVQDPDLAMHGLSRAAGTWQYMAPEQTLGYAGAFSDIYSLAKVLIEMLTGQRVSALLPKAALDLSERVRSLLAALPVRLSPASIDLISSALEYDPARRPDDAEQFALLIAADLERDLVSG